MDLNFYINQYKKDNKQNPLYIYDYIYDHFDEFPIEVIEYFEEENNVFTNQLISKGFTKYDSIIINIYMTILLINNL